MKNLKLLIVFAFLGVVGLSVKARATGYVTVIDTAVCLSSGSNIELTNIFLSTGNNSWGDIYIVLVDSLNATGCSAFNTSLANIANFSEAAYPPKDWILPPIIVGSTTTAVNQPAGIQAISLLDARGEGITVGGSILMFTLRNSAASAQGMIKTTVGYRKKR